MMCCEMSLQSEPGQQIQRDGRERRRGSLVPTSRSLVPPAEAALAASGRGDPLIYCSAPAARAAAFHQGPVKDCCFRSFFFLKL